MNKYGSTLIAHCGTRKVAREELQKIPVPEATRTHQPLSHYQIVEVLEESLSYRFLKVVRDEYAISPDGMRMFGVMDLDSEFDGCRFSIGLRNSNDKSMRLALTAGLRVAVCDNMMFSGDFNPLLHKHTRNLELADSIALAVDRIHRNFLPLRAKVSEMKKINLSDEMCKVIIYNAFVDKRVKGLPRHLLPQVHEHYFKPGFEEFEARNLWSLSNAFTSAFKRLLPVRQFEVTARLGAFLTRVQEDLGQNGELELNLQKRAEQNKKPDSADSSEKNFQLPAPPHQFGYFACGKDEIKEDRDPNEDDPENSYESEEFDEYFDSEEESDAIDEAEEELFNEFIRRAA